MSLDIFAELKSEREKLKSCVIDIKILEPRKRYTPKILRRKARPAIYAAADPAYAAGHGFPWKSDEGFGIYENKDVVTLKVPKKFEKRLNQKIYVYSLPADTFHLLKEDSPKARIYLSYKKLSRLK